MRISDYNFNLPDELIAQEPLSRRDESRLLVLNRGDKTFQDANFRRFPEFLRENDVLVLNNTRVFPARLIGNRETKDGGKAELFLVREIEKNVWETLARPAKRLKEGTKIVFGDGKLAGEIMEKQADGRCLVKFESDGDFYETLETIGQTPLPPYIKRETVPTENDRERYQTVFAKQRGAIAAPTAGLHFTPEIFDELRAKGVSICEITLHVGYGTFEPIRVDDLREHRVAPENAEISESTANFLNKAKAEKRRIIAVGTTTTRTLESFTDAAGKLSFGIKPAALTITPNYKFRFIDALLTNFHLPQSSLLMLVSTFAGREFMLSAYQHAVAEKYRFYSYGDCMFIE